MAMCDGSYARVAVNIPGFVLAAHECGTSLHRRPMRCEDGQTGGRPRPWHAKAQPHRISPTSTPPPTSPGGCGAPHEAFFCVDQGRHVNHLLVSLLYLT